MRLLRRRRDPAPPLPIVATAATAPAPLESLLAAFWRDVEGGPLPEQVGTVDRCLQLNAAQIATMPLKYRHGAQTQGFKPWWVEDPDPAWFPNGIGEAVFALVWSVYAQGEAFLWVTSRYEDGYPRTWTLLDPVTMQVRERDGQREFRSNGADLDPGDVLQIMRNPGGQLRGRSALAAYWANVRSAYEAGVYAADVYSASGVSRMALKAQGRVNEEQARTLQADWAAAVSRRLGAPAVIPAGLELQEILTVSPKDLMLVESRDWDTRQIAAAFGVPAMLLNVPVEGGLTYQNPAMLADLWWRTELMPTAVKVQRALSRWLPRGHWVEFDPSQTLRPDLATMTATWSKLLADQVVTADEYRAAVLDLPPLVPPEDEAQEIYEEAGAHGPPGPAPLAAVEGGAAA